MKFCKKCSIEKSSGEFYKGRAKCKACISNEAREYREANKEAIGRRKIQYRENNKEKVKASKKRYYEENKERILLKQKAYYEETREDRCETRKRWYENNKEENLAYQKRWREENYETYIAKCKKWRQENLHARRDRYHRIKQEPEFKASQAMRTVLSNFLRNIGATREGRTNEMLGYSYEEFKSHIEKQFVKGMSWDNRDEWHIDHIIPVIEHIRDGESDPKVVNALTNLRPIWSGINLSKGESMTHLI